MLYAIQGTGNGHISRANELIPELDKYGELDLLVSGTQVDLQLIRPPAYRFKGLSFYFGKKGGIDFKKTITRNYLFKSLREMRALSLARYDVIFNDFEPISAWAAHISNIPVVGFGHQASFMSQKVPRPKHTDSSGEWILRNYAPVKKYIGFHFEEYDTNIFHPVIRREVRNASPTEQQHYTVYLPAFGDEKIIPYLSSFKKITWHVFSKHAVRAYNSGNISVTPVSANAFTQSMISSRGVLCGAGFETPAEALHLGKKLLVVPMKAQYEQQCNAAALKKMGVPVLKKLNKNQFQPLKNG